MSKSSSPVEVLITLPFPPALIGELQNVSPRLRITVNAAQKVEEIPADLWTRCEVLYTDHVIPDPELAPAIKWIQFHWAGIEKLIDAPLLSKPQLQFTTLSGAAASQTAEYVLTMLLALGHQMPGLAASQKKQEWPRDRWQKFMPRELRNSTVGIVGYGSIGRQLARLLREFGATVLASKRDAMHPADTDYTPDGLGDPEGNLVHRLYPAEAIRTMAKDCDFLVVTVPLTQATQNLINAAVMASMKPTAFLIDISRGGVVDHNALVKALNEDRLAGAALDVFLEEPLPAKNPLWGAPNVIITPHIAGISKEYDKRAVDLFAENLSRYISDQPLYNIFDVKKGY